MGSLTRPERNLRNLYLNRALKSINCKTETLEFFSLEEQKLEKYSVSLLRVLRIDDFHSDVIKL